MSDVHVPQEIRTLTLAPNEVLLVRLPTGITMDQLKQWQDALASRFGHQRVLCYAAKTIEFLKVALQEKLIDELIDNEIQK